MYNYIESGDRVRASLTVQAKAYIIDITITIIILFLFSLFFSADTTILNEKMDDITLKYASLDIDFTTYMEKQSEIYKQIDTMNIMNFIFDIILIIIYFIIVPYFNKGQTIGKKIMKIKLNNMSLWKLFIRSLILNGLFYMIFVLFLILLIPDNLYFTAITLLGIIQIILFLGSIIIQMIRKDKRGLHDLITNTWVTEVK